MITASIGKMFLDAYNERYGTDYDAKTFFVEQFYPLFFDQNKYLMTAGNSPLENPKLSWGDMIKGKKEYETPEQRKSRFCKLMSKIDVGEADASIARGFPSLDVAATTSGQITDLSLPLSREEIFLSWFGDGLGVGVQGGFSILFSNKQILLDIYEGWKYYREMLNASRLMKGNQINTWNGQWLAHRYDRDYSDESPFSGFYPSDAGKDGIITLKTQSWTKVLSGIARNFDNIQLTGCVYSIGQTNTTVGFIPFNLDQIKRPYQLYRNLFDCQGLKATQAEELWGTAVGFRTACTYGVIGLKAMEPKGLRAYMVGSGANSPKVPKRPKDENQTITYQVYKTWLIAMLNNEDLWGKSQMLAQMLVDALTYKLKDITTRPKNLVDNVLSAVNKKQFVAAITEVVPLMEDATALKDIVKDVHEMPNDNVPYFLTLVRFQFSTLNK